jgi:preprotein translocase subunit SecG
MTVSLNPCWHSGLVREESLVGSVHMGMWAVWGWLPPLLNVVLLLVGLFLILLVLIQKGKGGGLAGAFGGSGGSSAFGSRAGDTFTRITIYVAAVWILLIMILIKIVQPTTPLQAPPGQVQPVPTDQEEGG